MSCPACGGAAVQNSIRASGIVRICANPTCRAVLSRVEDDGPAPAVRRPVDEAGMSAPVLAAAPAYVPPPPEDTGDDLDFSTLSRPPGGPSVAAPRAVAPLVAHPVATAASGPVDVRAMATARLSWLRVQLRTAAGYAQEARELEAVLAACTAVRPKRVRVRDRRRAAPVVPIVRRTAV